MVRPFEEALDIAKDEQFEDGVYDPQTGLDFPVRAVARPAPLQLQL